VSGASCRSWLPVAQKAAADDNTIIERQMEGYQQRLDLWYGRRSGKNPQGSLAVVEGEASITVPRS
jgi:hypothetical protein